MDAGEDGAAQVIRHPVRFLVIERRRYAAAAGPLLIGHGFLSSRDALRYRPESGEWRRVPQLSGDSIRRPLACQERKANRAPFVLNAWRCARAPATDYLSMKKP